MITILIESVSEQVVKAWEAELEITVSESDNANSTLHQYPDKFLNRAIDY